MVKTRHNSYVIITAMGPALGNNAYQQCTQHGSGSWLRASHLLLNIPDPLGQPNSQCLQQPLAVPALHEKSPLYSASHLPLPQHAMNCPLEAPPQEVAEGLTLVVQADSGKVRCAPAGSQQALPEAVLHEKSPLDNASHWPPPQQAAYWPLGQGLPAELTLQEDSWNSMWACCSLRA